MKEPRFTLVELMMVWLSENRMRVEFRTERTNSAWGSLNSDVDGKSKRISRELKSLVLRVKLECWQAADSPLLLTTSDFCGSVPQIETPSEKVSDDANGAMECPIVPIESSISIEGIVGRKIGVSGDLIDTSKHTYDWRIHVWFTNRESCRSGTEGILSNYQEIVFSRAEVSTNRQSSRCIISGKFEKPSFYSQTEALTFDCRFRYQRFILFNTFE